MAVMNAMGSPKSRRVSWAPGTPTPKPSRQLLHKRARGLSDDMVDEAEPSPPKRRQSLRAARGLFFDAEPATTAAPAKANIKPQAAPDETAQRANVAATTSASGGKAGWNQGQVEAAEQGEGEDLSKLTTVALKERLRARGLKVGGRKAELIVRLESS